MEGGGDEGRGRGAGEVGGWVIWGCKSGGAGH